MSDYYKILGLTPDASQHEIKQAFRKQALQYHPDKNNNKEANHKFQDIICAYEILIDPDKKMNYDFLLSHSISPFDGLKKRESTVFDSHYHPSKPIYDVMERYLPYFKWTCWAGVILTLLLAIDFTFLPHCLKEKITGMEDVYIKISKGVKLYDHTILTTEKNKKFILSSKDTHYFKNHQFVYIQSTLLLSKNITITPEIGTYKVLTSLLYGNLFFIPLLLFFTSMMGVLIHNKIEMVFNFSLVSSILLVIVLYLIML